MKNKFLTSVLIICMLLVSMFPTFVNAADSTIVNGKAGKTEYTIVAWESGNYDVIFETSCAFISCLIDNEVVSCTLLEGTQYKLSSVSLLEGMHKLSFEGDLSGFVLDFLSIEKLGAKSVVDTSSYYEMTFGETSEGSQNGGTFTNYRTREDVVESPYVAFEVVIPKSGNYKFGGVLSDHTNTNLSSWNIAIDDQSTIVPTSNMLKGQLEPYNHYFLTVYDFGELYLTEGTHYLKVTATTKRSQGGHFIKLNSFTLEIVQGEDEQLPESDGLAQIRIEGESGVLNQPLMEGDTEKSAFKSSDTASGGSEIRFAVNGEYTGDGYIFDYNFEIPKTAYYNMYYLGGNIGNTSVSIAELSLDDAEYIDMDSESFIQYEEGATSTSAYYVKSVPLYLLEGEHNLKIKVATTRASGGYSYNLDWIDFAELGFSFEAESEVIEYKEYSDVVINAVVGGYKKGDISQATFKCKSDDKNIAKYQDKKIYATGLGSTTLRASLKSETGNYEATCDITTVVNGLSVVETKVFADGSKGIKVKNNSDTDKTVCLVNVIRNSDGIAVKIVLDEVNVPSQAITWFGAETISECTNDIFLTDSETSLLPVSNMIQF